MTTALRKAYPVLLFVVALLSGAPAGACDLDAWSNVQDPGSALSPTGAARFEGGCGLRVDLDSGASTAFAEDATPGERINPVTTYTARFYIYMGDMTLVDGDAIEILSALDAESNPVFRLEIYAGAGGLHTRLLAYEDDGGEVVAGGSGMRLDVGWRAVELSWRAAGGDGANDGELAVSVDGFLGMPSDNLGTLDNDTLVIDRVRLGLLSSNGSTVTGVYDIDSFTSGAEGPMGLINKSCSGTDVAVDNMTFLSVSGVCAATGTLSFSNRVTFDPGSTTELSGSTVTFGPGVRIRSGATVTIR